MVSAKKCFYVLTCQRALRAYVLTCQRVLRAYVVTSQHASRAYVLRCQSANFEDTIFSFIAIVTEAVHTVGKV